MHLDEYKFQMDFYHVNEICLNQFDFFCTVCKFSDETFVGIQKFHITYIYNNPVNFLSICTNNLMEKIYILRTENVRDNTGEPIKKFIAGFCEKCSGDNVSVVNIFDRRHYKKKKKNSQYTRYADEK